MLYVVAATLQFANVATAVHGAAPCILPWLASLTVDNKQCERTELAAGKHKCTKHPM
jgi:hypothetical protein